MPSQKPWVPYRPGVTENIEEMAEKRQFPVVGENGAHLGQSQGPEGQTHNGCSLVPFLQLDSLPRNTLS